MEQSNGIGFLGALGLLFIGLKLGGAISWSWWWVLLPLYFPLALAAFALVIYLILSAFEKLANLF